MPFKSKSQLRTCFSRRPKGWNCNEWLRKTPSACCLPERVGHKVKHRCMRKGERIIGKVKTGPRGGKYFTIKERDSRGDICEIKIYLQRRRR